MDVTIIITTAAGLIGAIIGAVAGFLGNLYTIRTTIRQQQEQWRLNRQKEHEEWYQGKLQEIYSNCIDSLSKTYKRVQLYYREIEKMNIADSFSNSSPDPVKKAEVEQQCRKDIFLDHCEAQKWLSLLLIYHPTRDGDHFKKFCKDVKKFSTQEIAEQQDILALQDRVLDLASTDHRLQPLLPISAEVRELSSGSLTK